MYNITTHISEKKNIFHRYLLGDSLKHIFIRLIFILLIIIIIWCFIIIILINYIKSQKRKQIENIKLNSPTNQFKPNITFNSSPISISVNKEQCSFWTQKSRDSLQTQTTKEIMSRRPFPVKRIYSQNNNIDNDIQEDDNNEHQSTKYLQEYNTKLPLVLHSSTRSFPKINPSRSLLIKKDLTSTKRRHSSLNDADNIEKHLPLVMITDTNLSFTNIVELETFEDKYRVITDIEKGITHQLKASYQPRYST